MGHFLLLIYFFLEVHFSFIFYLLCSLFFLFFFLGGCLRAFFFNFIFKLYIIVLVLPNIKMNPPQVYMCYKYSFSMVYLQGYCVVHGHINLAGQCRLSRCPDGVGTTSLLSSVLKLLRFPI